MSRNAGTPRRSFLRNAALGIGAAAQQGASGQNAAPAQPSPVATPRRNSAPGIAYPRVFSGRQLAMIAFPLGGVGAGSLSLGGRGQLRDWEIFNRPNKGFSPAYAFSSIWVQAGKGKPAARVLEARILPPYAGADGLGSNNVPGLSRLAAAHFTGEYPLAHIDFQDSTLPVQVGLDAFSPFIPHDADESGLPVAVLRYRVSNPGRTVAQVSIAFSIDNPVKVSRDQGGAAVLRTDARENEFRTDSGMSGLIMRNPALAPDDPMKGEFVIAVLDPGAGLTHWRGWPRSRWWNAPMLFWDDFSADGELGPEPEPHSAVGSISLKRSIAAGAKQDFTFVFAWRFPNRTPEWCGWSAPKGDEKTIIGNWYATRFASAWDAASHVATHLPDLEKRTRAFATALRESTLPPAVKDAASANLSTLASTTCFRTADGEFHGFEGVGDKSGCCFGNCTHVWNFETATAHLFPSLSRSLRKASFGYSMDDAGAIHFRQLLPDGKARSGFAAADGQMGQIIHAYLDYKLSGDADWLRGIWPRVKQALEFAWVKGGWDADRDGVMEGVQHNTYDVEFYGPNPMCGVYYLGGLRAAEEMAKAVGDEQSAADYRRLFESGSRWIDQNLFNGEFYIQKVRGFRKDEIAHALRSEMGSEDTEKPEYQAGEGCLADQLMGQYLAHVAGLGPLLSPDNIRKTLQSIYRYNWRRSLEMHNSVQRTYALNDESGLLVCDYGKGERPHIPFPYYAEVWTGFEYQAASLMYFVGMIHEGDDCVAGARARYDGVKRNPWDEEECGHHYVRPMSAWSTIVALGGFHYDGHRAAISAIPRVNIRQFRSFWSTGTGWGSYARSVKEGGAVEVAIRVLGGKLPCSSCEIRAPEAKTGSAMLNGKSLRADFARTSDRAVFRMPERVAIDEGGELRLEARG